MKRSGVITLVLVLVIFGLFAMPAPATEAELVPDPGPVVDASSAQPTAVPQQGCWGTSEAGFCIGNKTIYETCLYYGKPHCAPVTVDGPFVTCVWVEERPSWCE